MKSTKIKLNPILASKQKKLAYYTRGLSKKQKQLSNLPQRRSRGIAYGVRFLLTH